MSEQQIPTMSRGIRKVNELLLQENRALIITEEDATRIAWEDIPYGTLKINQYTGVMSVKLRGALLTQDNKILENAVISTIDKKVYTIKGAPIYKDEASKVQYAEDDIVSTSESGWVPAGIRNDGSICIAKDTIILEEVFTIKELDVPHDDGAKGFICENTEGQRRHFRKKDDAYVFELEKGSYIPGRNYLEVYIDDVLRRDRISDNLLEISDRRVGLNEELVVDQEITIKYAKTFRVGNPYPRIFMSKSEPEASEEGDMWLDPDGIPSKGDGFTEEDFEETTGMLRSIQWEKILNKPTSIMGYGITDEIEYKNHVHNVKDIVDFPTRFVANGGNCDTIQNLHVGTKPNNIVKLDNNGKISSSCLPPVSVTISDVKGLTIGDLPAANAEVNSIWFDTREKVIKFKTETGWVIFGAAYL